MNTLAPLPALPARPSSKQQLQQDQTQNNPQPQTSLPPGLFAPLTRTPSATGAGAAPAGDDEDDVRAYFLEAVQPVPDDSDDELTYEEVPVEEFEESSDTEGEETLEKAVRSINEKSFFGVSFEPPKSDEPVPKLTRRPEVIDDYIRNYLSSKGLLKSLDAFQNEWYECQQKGKLSPEDTTIVPDVYQRNQDLADALQKLRVDVENYKDIASKARSTYDKLRKERDFHRMHHKRVVQEKNKLIADIKRLKKHYEGYEPTLKQLQHKYEVAMKEKMLTKLERDRLAAKVVGLENTLRSLEKNYKESPTPSRASPAPRQKGVGTHPTRKQTSGATATTSNNAPVAREATLPSEDRPNPHIGADLPTAKSDRLRPIHVVRAHDLAVSAVKFHPKKMILATVSDDKTWKMWAFPSGELIMSGSGHKDWIADCDFHPRGAHLSTASGDATIKIWDFAKGSATLTLSDHTQAVWSCAFHDAGDFLASASMDHTAKLWDLHTGKCRQTFRGHSDSVNQVGFQPYTNTLFTCSGDKTVSLWDARTGLCCQTLYGHMNAINCVAFSLRADAVASCDADGTVKFWDIRNVSELSSVDCGPHPANRIAFDPSGTVLSVAGNDGIVRLVSGVGGEGANAGRGGGIRVRELAAHSDACQSVVFDRNAEFLVSAGSDCTYRIFQ